MMRNAQHNPHKTMHLEQNFPVNGAGLDAREQVTGGHDKIAPCAHLGMGSHTGEGLFNGCVTIAHFPQID
eukprot:13169742-Alexandrium_andersonii.AAC.1